MAWNLMKIKHTRSSTYQAPAATILLANGFVRGEIERHGVVLGFISHSSASMPIFVSLGV